jgi:3-oxoacyl-[acyl-carrier-protein] synthase I
MDAGIYITALEMVTPLGPDAGHSCAAFRAGILRMGELKNLNFLDKEMFGDPVQGHTIAFLPSGFVGSARALLMGCHALSGLLGKAPYLKQEKDNTGFFLNLSDYALPDRKHHLEKAFEAELERQFGVDDDPANPAISMEDTLPSKEWRRQHQGVLPKLLERCDLILPSSHQHLYFGGHTGVIYAIHDAMEAIRAGKYGRCIVGAIDSFIEPPVLEAGALTGMLKTQNNPSGFIPGEAAGFFLLEKQQDAVRKESQLMLLISDLALEKEKFDRFSEDPPLGKALYRALDRLLDSEKSLGDEVGCILCDLNGDIYRANDWGYALVRLQTKYSLGNLPMFLPAVGFGETGAATGVLSLGIMNAAFRNEECQGSAAILWLFSESGERGGLLVKILRS